MTIPFLPYGRQDITDDDVAAVISVLRSDYLTQGPVVVDFERAIAGYCGAKYGVAVNSATSALHIACLALGLSPGDVLWTTPNTFVASANCALYCGATVDFVDIEANTHNMCVGALEKKLHRAKISGHLPKVVIPVHFAGQSCDMASIRELGDQFGFRIIEDASHAIGAGYRGRPVGNCRYSDITVFSFHPVKIITSGEGGVAVTNNSEVAEQMARLRSHGVTRDPRCMRNSTAEPWYYEMVELGLNYRMTDIQAALGLSQIRRIDEYVMQRRKLADRYDALLAGTGVMLPSRNQDCQSSWHLYVIGWDEKILVTPRRVAFESFRAVGIGVNVHYIPVHTQPYYRALGFNNGDFPQAEQYYQSAITLPLFPTMTELDQDRVIAVIQSLGTQG